ncbi:MAG TPA: PaaX family transcriptional regulator C-terminal domain-containing protein, partial [Stellaceae bacterium]|nr:PaaX family transcriptional regulator C-terminal domain-containing protein [Stellaceae bacterium]
LWLSPTGGRLPSVSMLRLSARTDEATARILAARSWALDRMAVSYHRFVEAFSPLETEPGDHGETASFVGRALLIHEFRRIVLHDPNLPARILPADWPGTEARALCGRLYHRLLAASERWLDEAGRTEIGALPPPGPELRRRFHS